MTTGVPIIDLDRAPRGPDPARRRTRPWFPVPRAGRFLAVLALTLAAAGAADAPAPGLRPVLPAGVAANGYTLGEDTFYTSAYGMDNPNGEAVVRRYDLADGSVRWTAMVPQGVPAGCSPAATSTWQAGARFDDRTVLAVNGSGKPDLAFLDAVTGRLVRRLGTVAPVGDLMLDRDSAQPQRTWVLAGRRLRSLGAVDVVAPYSCVTADRYLACPTSTGTIQVWRRPVRAGPTSPGCSSAPAGR